MIQTTSSRKARALTFTLNNYSEVHIQSLKEAEWIVYGICGEERAGSVATGTPHLQGYIQFKRKRIKGVTDKLESLLGVRPHCEIAMGNLAQNQVYCRKEADKPWGNVHEWGEASYSGKRTDIDELYNMARSDRTKIDCADEAMGTMIRYVKGFEKVREWHNEAEAEEFRTVQCYVHSGPTGSGKTRAAMEHKEDERAPFKIQGDQLAWWDGYEGQKTIVIDEYSNDVKVTKLLGLLDGYKLRLPVKGGFTYARWTTVHITTNLKKSEVHEAAKDEHKAALNRRVTEWKSYWHVIRNPWSDSLRSAAESTVEMADESIFSDDVASRPRPRKRRRTIFDLSYSEYESQLGGYAQDPDHGMFADDSI